MCVVATVGMIGMAGCAAKHDNSSTQPAISATSTMSSNTVGLPEAIPNLKTLYQQPATSGTADAGSFFAHKGDVWINFNCRGSGGASVIYSPVGSIDVPCGGSAVNATKNKIYFSGDHQVGLRVEVSGSALWSVLVQQ